ncbi:PGF-pre-PGF domain-containing protein [Halorussus aquaticus]|uniref:PGF-pre-PGF domain-containing protein n=1 Tax=Halorussus aquaticus TaxID=2953748 RepID=A0ABD5PZU2_9EURY|nr:PGF-pre-PGF domain-containing protein [Halorussus aquaticus]
MHRKSSCVVLVGLLVLSVVAVGGVGTAAAANASLDSGNVPLEDGSWYWQGQYLYNDTVADAGERLGLYNATADDLVRNVTADDSRAFDIDTSDLDGDYYLRNESGETVVSFSVEAQRLSFDSNTENYYLVANGTAAHVKKLGLDSNRHEYDLVVESSSLNLTERIDGAREVDGRTVVFDVSGDVVVDTRGLEAGTYRINASVPDTTAVANYSFRPSNVSEVRWELHREETVLADGETYWQSRSLTRDYGVADAKLKVVRSRDGAFAQEFYTNETGVGTIDTTHLGNGTYEVRNSGNDTLYASFSIVEQNLSTSLADDTVTDGTGTTNLSVASNRTGYDLLLWSETVERANLSRAVPASTVTSEGDLAVRNLSSDASLTVDYSALSAGTYTFHVSVADTRAKANATLEVTAESSGGDDGEGSGSGGGGGGGNVPPPSVRTETVEAGEDYRRFEISSARSDSPATVSLSGLGTDRVSFEELRIRPESDDPEPRFFVNASSVDAPAVRAPADVDTLGYLRVEPTYVRNADLGSVTVEFAVPTDATDPESVRLYRHTDGAWQPLSTEFVEKTGGKYVFRAEATGVSLFAVTADESMALDNGTDSSTRTATVTASATAETTAETTADTSATTTTRSSGGAGHAATSVLAPLVALAIAVGYRTRND